MIILDLNLAQNFKILPIRETSNLDEDFAPSYLCTFVDEQTKQVFDRQPMVVNDYNDLFYMFIDDLDFLYENAFFHFQVRILPTNEIIYRDRVFVTTQNLNTFSVNNGVYTSAETNNNEYIII